MNIDEIKNPNNSSFTTPGKQEFTITVYTENQIGLLNRIAIIFSRRKINIHYSKYFSF